MATRGSRAEKVKRIFQQFDTNGDGGLNRQEMAALVVAVNPRVKFSEQQINAILDEVFRTYGEFIDGEKGLTFDGLLRTYDDGAGDVDRDFDALALELDPLTAISEASSSSIADEQTAGEFQKKQRIAAWAASPNSGIVFDDTWKLVDDLEVLIKRLCSPLTKDGKIKGDASDACSDAAGWSTELGAGAGDGEKRIVWDERGPGYAQFVKELAVLRSQADAARSREEAFDGHMAIGRVLYDQQLFKESLVSFKRACDLQPTDARAHFRTGSALYILGDYTGAKGEFIIAMEAAEASGSQRAYLLPQIHINLGIALEGEGMVLSACEHYREAAILCPAHYRALKLLGSALFGVGEYHTAETALEEAVLLKPDYADAHCDLGSTLHSMGDDEKAIQEFQKAIDLRPGHVDALYNLGRLYMDMGRYQRASEMYTRVLMVSPSNWRAQVNKAVALLGAGDAEEASRALRDAFKMTNRVELYDAMVHLKILQKKKSKHGIRGNGHPAFLVTDTSKFKEVGRRTTLRKDLAVALQIRAFQKLTKLNGCHVELLMNEMNEANIPTSYSGSRGPEKSIRKAAFEVILRKLLHFLKPDTFQGSVRAINERIISVLDGSGSGSVDMGMLFATLAPICSGPSDKRKRAAYDALLWRPVNGGGSQIRRADAMTYIKILRSVYAPTLGTAEMELHEETDVSMVSFPEFLEIFDNQQWGFGIMDTLLKLEKNDRQRHRHTCVICNYPITGSRFKEISCRFSLCSHCYSQGMIPSAYNREEYKFKEYDRATTTVKERCMFFIRRSRSSPKNP